MPFLNVTRKDVTPPQALIVNSERIVQVKRNKDGDTELTIDLGGEPLKIPVTQTLSAISISLAAIDV